MLIRSMPSVNWWWTHCVAQCPAPVRPSRCSNLMRRVSAPWPNPLIPSNDDAPSWWLKKAVPSGPNSTDVITVACAKPNVSVAPWNQRWSAPRWTTPRLVYNYETSTNKNWWNTRDWPKPPIWRPNNICSWPVMTSWPPRCLETTSTQSHGTTITPLDQKSAPTVWSPGGWGECRWCHDTRRRWVWGGSRASVVHAIGAGQPGYKTRHLVDRTQKTARPA